MKQNVEANEREKAIQVAQEAVTKMKHFALTMPNTDQRQKLNASQVRESAKLFQPLLLSSGFAMAFVVFS